jgi:hypothetical protein
MKNLILSTSVLALLQSCSSGSSSGGGAGSGVLNPPVISDPSSSVYSQMIENKIYLPLVANCIRESAQSPYYYRESFSKANNEFLHMREYHQENTCNSLQFYASRIMTFVSYSVIADEQKTSLSLIDFQISIADQFFLDAFNASEFYGFNNWTLGNAKSVIDRKRVSTDVSNQFITGSITDYSLRKVSDVIFINGVQYQ